jgi:hypothetical protein
MAVRAESVVATEQGHERVGAGLTMGGAATPEAIHQAPTATAAGVAGGLADDDNPVLLRHRHVVPGCRVVRAQGESRVRPNQSLLSRTPGRAKK